MTTNEQTTNEELMNYYNDAAVDLDVIPIRPQDCRDLSVQTSSQKPGRIGTDDLPHVVPVQYLLHR